MTQCGEGWFVCCACVRLHAHQEGWTHPASLSWIQIGSLLLMSHCRDIWERSRVSNEARTSQSGQWGGVYEDRKKVKAEIVGAGKSQEWRKARVNILSREWHGAPVDYADKPVLTGNSYSYNNRCLSLSSQSIITQEQKYWTLCQMQGNSLVKIRWKLRPLHNLTNTLSSSSERRENELQGGKLLMKKSVK